jgi:hypothetical protein
LGSKYSALENDRHHEALTYVKSAIEDYTQLQADKLAGKETYEELNLFSLLQSLSIAHFNEGVEWEHLRSYG